MHGKAIKERQIASGIVHMTEECDNWELETWQLRNEQWALKKKKKSLDRKNKLNVSQVLV